MARWLRRLAILSTVAAFVGAGIALLSVWMAPDQYCAWKLCTYNGLYPPPPPPRIETIGLVVGPTLPFSVYWMVFAAILLNFAVTIFVSQRRPRLLLVCSVVALGALALLFFDARLPIIYSWTYLIAPCSGFCNANVTPVRYALPSEWLFLWCFAPCCVAVVAQCFALGLGGPHPLSPSPTGEGVPAETTSVSSGG